jgi:hypothetical protein
MKIDLKSYFTPEAIATSLQTLAPLKSPIMDTFFATRKNHPLPVVATSDLQQTVANIYMSKRGSEPEPIYSSSQDITHIEPQPFRPSERLNGVDMNNLKLLSGDSIQTLVNNKIDRLRRAIRLSTEVMAIQSLRGAISYPMKVNGASGTYSVNFGSTLSFTPATLWDDAGISVSKVLEDLIAMEALIQEQSQFGADVKFVCGVGVFTALAKLVADLGSEYQARIENKTISILGYNIELQNGTYSDLSNDGAVTKIIGDKELMAVAVDAPFELVYAALDDLDSGLVAMPFFAKQVEDSRSSSIEIIAESKPLPVPYTKAVCWADVIS